MKLHRIAALVAVVMLACAAVAVAKTSSFKPARAGKTLTAPAKYKGHRIKRYQWERCGKKGRTCSKLKGRTFRRYTVRKADVGHTFRVQLTVQTASGQTTVTSAPTPVIAPPAPINTVLPSIGGTAQQGDTLTSSPGTWTNAVSYSYQWEDCDTTGANCTSIAGATGTTYTLQASDVGHTIRLAVTAYNTNAGTTTADSRAIG